MKKDLNYYLNLPWSYAIETDKDEKGTRVYVITINEFPEVSTHGYSIQEAMELVKEAMTLAIEMHLEAGDEIPEPIDEDQYQGNIAYRTTPRRHHLIAKEAQKRGQSLSKVIDTLIDTATQSVNTKK